MELSLFSFVLPSFAPAGGVTVALIFARWIHLIAGVMWIGLLYFFVLVNPGFMGELDQKTRTLVFSELMPRAMFWFRWSALVTVIAGFGYWNYLISADVQASETAGHLADPSAIIISFLVIWTVAFAIEMALVMAPLPVFKTVSGLGIVMALVLLACTYVFLKLNQRGWESNRTLCIGIGGGLGWFMMLNVWGIVWRMQKKLIHWNAAALTGSPAPPEARNASKIAAVVAGVSFWVSFPMLFFMGAASHYTMFVQ